MWRFSLLGRPGLMQRICDLSSMTPYLCCKESAWLFLFAVNSPLATADDLLKKFRSYESNGTLATSGCARVEICRVGSRVKGTANLVRPYRAGASGYCPFLKCVGPRLFKRFCPNLAQVLYWGYSILSELRSCSPRCLSSHEKQTEFVISAARNGGKYTLHVRRRF